MGTPWGHPWCPLTPCPPLSQLMPAPTAVPEPKKLLVAAALAVALARP